MQACRLMKPEHIARQALHFGRTSCVRASPGLRTFATPVRTSIPSYENGGSIDALVRNIRRHMAEKPTLSTNEVDVPFIKRLLHQYKIRGDEWLAYGQPDPHRNYTRIPVDTVDGKCNLLFIVWNPGQKSPIHDHADAHCIMKIVKGSLKETVYHSPTLAQPRDKPLSIKKETIYDAEQIAYISDTIGLHYICNPNPNEVAVSLHCYTPPYAAQNGFHVYCEKTGKSSHVR